MNIGYRLNAGWQAAEKFRLGWDTTTAAYFVVVLAEEKLYRIDPTLSTKFCISNEKNLRGKKIS